MVLTPRFELSQSDNSVTINIYAPYTRINDTEIDVDKDVFYFFSEPYLLRLKLPGEIVENDQSSATYDCDSRTFLLKFDKVNKGEYFKDLDMITTLLAPPRKNKNITPTIEVIGNEAADDIDVELGDDESDEHDWFIPQSVPSSDITILPHAPKYGFANKISGALAAFDEGMLKGVINLPNPDSTPMNQRKDLREDDERIHFCDDHYIVDLIETDENIKLLIDFTPEWYNLTSNNITFTDREKDILKELPNKEYLLDNSEIETIKFGLVDILFGSCYTHRITMGENNVESGWDINTISATLSWLENFTNMQQVITTSIKRSLSYPQYRHWELSLKVFDDVKEIIKLGKKYILKRFCEIYELFNNSFEPRYLLNQLYIRDYLIYIQQAPDLFFESIAETLSTIKPIKENMELDLIELEAAAWSVIEDEKLNTIENNLTATKYKNNYAPEYFINNIVDEVDKLVLNDEKSSDNSGSKSNTSILNILTNRESTSSSSSSSSCSSSSSSSSTSTTSTSNTSSSSSSDCSDSDTDSDSETSTESKTHDKKFPKSNVSASSESESDSKSDSTNKLKTNGKKLSCDSFDSSDSDLNVDCSRKGKVVNRELDSDDTENSSD